MNAHRLPHYLSASDAVSGGRNPGGRRQAIGRPVHGACRERMGVNWCGVAYLALLSATSFGGGMMSFAASSGTSMPRSRINLSIRVRALARSVPRRG